MGIPVLIIGRSGTGKTASLRNCGENWGVIKAINKPFPFRSAMPAMVTDDYTKIKAVLAKSKASSMVIDDAGYLITNAFMKEHSNKGAGNAVYALYNSLADNFWSLVMFISEQLPDSKIVYIMMHEDMNDFGDVKPKTIGKLLDEKVCIEGMFTIVLRSVSANGQYKFITQAADGAVSKSPIGMFETLEIDNDLAMVDKTIREYYGGTANE